MTAPDEFVPCRTGCQTCAKNSPFVGGGVMRWQPGDGVYPFGPPAKPWNAADASIRAMVANGAVLDEIASVPERPAPKPTPRRPLLAGHLRRLLP